MNIVVCLRKIWGKDLFYPVSDDAQFITEFTGRPTILKNQLQLCKEKGWKVTIIQQAINLEDYLPSSGKIYE